jgi:hypothetical protein
MSKHHSEFVSIASAVDGSQTAEEFRIENHISKTTWNRLRARGDTPKLTWITSRKYIIRRHHGREWLDQRMSRPGDAPSVTASEQSTPQHKENRRL